MLLTDHSLAQLDDASLETLSLAELRPLSKKLLHDLKEARERLNQHPGNSSRPPSSQAPWERGESKEDPEGEEEDVVEPEADAEQEPSGEKGVEEDTVSKPKPRGSAPNKPGKPLGAPGFGRTQPLPVTATVEHRPEACAACGHPADSATPMKAWTGHYTVDIDGGNPEAPGIQVTHTKHLYYEMSGLCGHHTREAPHRSENEALWEGVGLTDWRLVGANLCALIVALSFRLRASRRGVREFLWDWLGVALSVGTLQPCILEAARAAAPVEDSLQAETVNND
jgi:transposase